MCVSLVGSTGFFFFFCCESSSMSLASSNFFKQFFSLQFVELLFIFIATSYMHCGILVLSILQSLFYIYVALSSGLSFSHFFFLVL